MFDHVEIPVADLARSRRFYDAALAPLGMICDVDIAHRPPLQRGLVGYKGDGDASFALLGGGPVVGCVRLAFRAPSPEAVAAFVQGGAAAGGRMIVPHPVFLPRRRVPLCQAALFDPDGHQVEVFCDDPD